VLDVAGRRVRTLVVREFGAGTRELVFDGKDDAGREVPPGVYRVLARVGGQTSSRTIVLVQ
jgi:flagellar hook assembly protein FlgD